MEEAWQLENLLRGTYVDSTAVDPPGRFAGDGYEYRVADITVEEKDSCRYRLLKRVGGSLTGRIITEFVFDQQHPDPAAITGHPRFAPDAEIDAADNRLYMIQPITSRDQYEDGLEEFNTIVEDLID